MNVLEHTNPPTIYLDYHYYFSSYLEFVTGGEIANPTWCGLFYGSGVYSYFYDYDGCSRLSKN